MIESAGRPLSITINPGEPNLIAYVGDYRVTIHPDGLIHIQDSDDGEIWDASLPSLVDELAVRRMDKMRTFNEVLDTSGHVMTVEWDERDRTYDLGARADKTSEWVMMQFNEDEVDTMLAMGRDIMTGG